MDITLKNIIDDINELSDINLQRKLWLNENNNTGFISSYAELMCRLFDDNGFDTFIDKAASKIGMSNELILALNKLRSCLKNYKEKDSDEEIINDLEWKKIVKQAQIVVKKW
jgi:hypothetical protein